MTDTRILVAEMPPMLREIVIEAVAEHADMRVVAERIGHDGLLPAARDRIADVMILGAEQADDTVLCSDLLWASPEMCVLVLTSTAGGAAIYELLPHRTALGDISPRGLIQALRSCAAKRDWRERDWGGDAASRHRVV